MSLRSLRFAALLVVATLAESAVGSEPAEVVLAHPIYAEYFACGEHAAGQLKGLGDELGTDCTIQRFVLFDDKRLFAAAYRADGSRNEDWFGWLQPVLSPADAVVEKIDINPVTNTPGRLGKPPASSIQLLRDDGVRFVLAHVRDVSVEEGVRVTAGQPIAKVGNNGFGRAPHIHMGAWRDDTPLQIRFDQHYMQFPEIIERPDRPQ